MRIAATFRLQVATDEKQRREIGARIKDLRASRGFKQQYIADQVGVELRTYQMWQAGDTLPEQANLEKLAELFAVTPTYILRGETPGLASRNGEQVVGDILARLKALDQRLEELALAQAEAAARDAEALKRIEEALRPRRRSRRQPPQ